jgi:predicted transcriptional regulator
MLVEAIQGATRLELTKSVDLNRRESEKFLSFLVENELLGLNSGSTQELTLQGDENSIIYKTSEKGIKLLESYYRLQN